MAGHGHGHGGGCGHEHHDCERNAADRGSEFSLYLKIDLNNVNCLNEAVEGSGKTVFKPWNERSDFTKFVESDADEELLFNIPFTGNVKLKAIIVIGAQEETCPSKMKLYKNRPNMTFDDTNAQPEQEFDLVQDTDGSIEYATKVVKFNSVQHLTLYFPSNFGGDTTKIYYIGLKGDFTEANRNKVVITTYEARANPADHKSNAFDNVHHEIN